jgi:pyruvate/2-oxoglutarate dehydrogenase complex dihydrolipoamide acyltransferase (E2) component
MTDIVIAENLWEEGEAAISAWLYQDGDRVAAGAIVAELMVEKSTMEIIAPASGTLRILVAAEEPVAKGQIVARIEP